MLHRAWRCCWVSYGFFRGCRHACSRLLMVCLDTLPPTPRRSPLICHTGLKRSHLHCCTISLSSASVVTFEQPLSGRSLMLPACLHLVTRRLSPRLVISKRAAVAEKDCPVSAVPTIHHLISPLFLRLAESDLHNEQQETGDWNVLFCKAKPCKSLSTHRSFCAWIPWQPIQGTVEWTSC